MKGLALALALVVLAPAPALAHGGEPVGITVVEGPEGVTVTLDRPLGSAVDVDLGAGCACTGEGAPVLVEGRVSVERRYACPEPLVGRSIGARGLDAEPRAALLRVATGGVDASFLLTAAAPRVVVPPCEGALARLARHVRAGGEHLLCGLDHVLFLLGVAALARGARSLAAVLTAFAAGHAATLVLATLGWVALPTRLVEVAIAATLVWLGARVVRDDGVARPPGRLAAAAFGFGLVHGLGLAGGLRSAGLSEAELPLALFGFNVGVELAQLALVAFGAALWVGVARLGRARLAIPRLRVAAGFAVGALAASWVLERALG